MHETTMRRWMAPLAALVFALGTLLSGTPSGLDLVPSAQAGESVSVSVSVARGTKGGSGVDPALGRFKGTLELISGYGGWTPAGSANLKVPVGHKQKQAFGDQSFEVTAESISGGKAKTSISVTDRRGSPNTMRSSLRNGGSTVVMMRSADGATVRAYIVTVSF